MSTTEDVAVFVILKEKNPPPGQDPQSYNFADKVNKNKLDIKATIPAATYYLLTFVEGQEPLFGQVTVA